VLRPGYIFGAKAVGLRQDMVAASRRGHRYVATRSKGRLSVIHTTNCAHAHVLAAEHLSFESPSNKTTDPKENTKKKPAAAGQIFFLRDFEAVPVDLSIEAFRNTPIIPVILPLWLALTLAWLVHHSYRLFACLGGSIPNTALDVHVIPPLLTVGRVTSDHKARSLLNYEPIVSREQCIKDARDWCTAFYDGLLSVGTNHRQYSAPKAAKKKPPLQWCCQRKINFPVACSSHIRLPLVIE